MTIKFTLDGREVQAGPDETIWQVAQREGTTIPHLCYLPKPGYRPDGNCRACMVEVEGERVLAASCIRKPAEGMKVAHAVGTRQKIARAGVRTPHRRPAGARRSHTIRSRGSGTGSARWASTRPAASRERLHPAPDVSHPAMAVNLDACIHCNLCVRACREVQVNDVIGMAYRGHGAKVVFDFDDPMGASTCVACGECVQACPTGALMEASLLDDAGVRTQFETACGRHALPLLRRRLPDLGQGQGRQDPLRRWPRRPGQREPALREGPLRLRLHPQSRPADGPAHPPRRRAEARRCAPRPCVDDGCTSARRPGRRRWSAPPPA